jgi:hypothetical protein
VDCPLLSQQQWAAALRTAGFGDLELATDIVGHCAVYVATAQPLDNTTDARVLKPLHIITTPSIKTKSRYQTFCNDLAEFFATAGYKPEFIDFPDQADVTVRYVVIEDGAEPLVYRNHQARNILLTEIVSYAILLRRFSSNLSHSTQLATCFG